MLSPATRRLAELGKRIRVSPDFYLRISGTEIIANAGERTQTDARTPERCGAAGYAATETAYSDAEGCDTV